MKTLLVALLMHLYPRAWRAEYGAELERMLLARRLGAAVTIDVAASAAWQRMRAIEALAVAGIGLMLVTIAVLVWHVMAPPSYASFSERIGLLQRPMRSELYVLVIAVVGFWTAFRGTHPPGRAAIRASIIGTIPLVVVGS